MVKRPRFNKEHRQTGCFGEAGLVQEDRHRTGCDASETSAVGNVEKSLPSQADLTARSNS